MEKVLITGCAGFIGYHLAKRFLEAGIDVVGIDNLNEYYDVSLKRDRLTRLKHFPSFLFHEIDICSSLDLKILEDIEFSAIFHLAAQAGVRYSLECPDVYVNTNVVGSQNILQVALKTNTKHLLMASTSSVYGDCEDFPLTEDSDTSKPISIYSATKKSMEVLSYSYSKIYDLPITNMRFFTVYGPWGRPDMALFKFVRAALNGLPIDVYNNGDMYRDFTYIDDLVTAMVLLGEVPPLGPIKWRACNIGNQQSIPLMNYISEIEKVLNVSIEKNYLPMQQGDVYKTEASTDTIFKCIGYRPNTNIKVGVREFIKWYQNYYAN